MNMRWKIIIQYYSMALTVLILGIHTYKTYCDHWGVPLALGIIMTLIFGGYIHNMDKIIKEDGTYKTEKELQDEIE